MGLFAALANAGAITGGADEDKDVANYEKNILGIIPYSFKIGDKWYSYEWINPMGTNAAMTADMIKAVKNSKSDKDIVEIALGAIQSGGTVLFNQSFMQSIQTLFKSDTFVQGLIDGLVSEPSVYMPQLISQLASMLDDTKRQAYDKNSKLNTTINKVLLKMPFARNMLDPQLDVLGREIPNNNCFRIHGVFERQECNDDIR